MAKSELLLSVPLFEEVRVSWVHRVDQLQVQLFELFFETELLRDILKEALEDLGPVGQMLEHEHMVVGFPVQVLFCQGVFTGNGLPQLAENDAQTEWPSGDLEFEPVCLVLLFDDLPELAFHLLRLPETEHALFGDRIVAVLGQVLPEDDG